MYDSTASQRDSLHPVSSHSWSYAHATNNTVFVNHNETLVNTASDLATCNINSHNKTTHLPSSGTSVCASRGDSRCRLPMSQCDATEAALS